MPHLQNSVKDIKLKHLGKGSFLEILESTKVHTFLQWLLEKELLIHFSVLDVMYWSIVDIIDSILTEYGHTPLFAIHRELKNDLYETLRADLRKPIEIFQEYSYPNVGKDRREEFIKELKLLFIERRNLLPDFNFRMLAGLLDIATKLESLPFLEDEEENTLIKNFGLIYLHQVIMFRNAFHVFDTETFIQEPLKEMAFDDDKNPMQNYRFADSSMEDGIQISDVVIGLIGKCFTYINQNDSNEIGDIKSRLSEIQSNNLHMLGGLIDLSISECPAFAHYVLSNKDMCTAQLLFEE